MGVGIESNTKRADIISESAVAVPPTKYLLVWDMKILPW